MKSADVTKPHSDQDRGIYFWRQGLSGGGEVLCSSHATQFTQYWCKKCDFAQNKSECFRGHGKCEAANIGQLDLFARG